MKKRSLGIIDVGTNSVLALGITEEKEVVFNDYAISEFGKGLLKTNYILPKENIERCFQIISHFVDALKKHKPDKIIVCGTSASRDAKNSDELAQLLEEKHQLKFQILSGEEEAKYSYFGGLSLFDEIAEKEFCMIDIGGGSTELISGKGFEIKESKSLQLGVIRLKDRFDFPYQFTSEDIEELDGYVSSCFRREWTSHPKGFFVGIGGTFTSLASIAKKIDRYRPDLINGTLLKREKIEEIFYEINHLNEAKRKALIGLEEKRAGVILYGISILLNFMKVVDLKELIVTDFGLRFGLANEYFKSGTFA